jgi:hypothetical protein
MCDFATVTKLPAFPWQFVHGKLLGHLGMPRANHLTHEIVHFSPLPPSKRFRGTTNSLNDSNIRPTLRSSPNTLVTVTLIIRLQHRTGSRDVSWTAVNELETKPALWASVQVPSPSPAGRPEADHSRNQRARLTHSQTSND